jgi:hypothetical protein
VGRTVSFRRRLDERWRDAPSHALGAPAAGRAAPDVYALVQRGSAPELRLDLYAAPDQLHAYHQALEIGDLLAVGFGHEVHLVAPWPAPPRTLRLRSYFVSLHRGADALYVASGEDVTRLDADGAVRWTSPQIAVDGVRVELVTDDVVMGEADEDPPGGWRPFQLDARDGTPL